MVEQIFDLADWQDNLLEECYGVKLVEIGVGVYMIEYTSVSGLPYHQVFYDWFEAKANYARRVHEATPRVRYYVNVFEVCQECVNTTELYASFCGWFRGHKEAIEYAHALYPDGAGRRFITPVTRMSWLEAKR